MAVAAPRTAQLFGVGTQGASQLLVTAGQNIDRLKSEAAFAKICGAAPIEASSGRTTRHRLDYGGDRQANRALHMIAVCRLRHCERTRAYARESLTRQIGSFDDRIRHGLAPAECLSKVLPARDRAKPAAFRTIAWRTSRQSP